MDGRSNAVSGGGGETVEGYFNIPGDAWRTCFTDGEEIYSQSDEISKRASVLKGSFVVINAVNGYSIQVSGGAIPASPQPDPINGCNLLLYLITDDFEIVEG